MRLRFLPPLLLVTSCLLFAALSVAAATTKSPMSAEVLAAKGLEALQKLGFTAVSNLAKEYIPLLQEDDRTQEIMEKLEEIIEQLKEIQQSLAQIDKFLNQISVQQFLIPANEHKSAITSLHDQMIMFISTAAYVKRDQWEANLKVLKANIDSIAYKESQQLKDLLLGNIATQSLFAAMQAYLLSIDNTVVQEYVTMRQVGYLYWSSFQQSADLFDFLSENGTNAYYVEQANKMLSFVKETDTFLTDKFLSYPALKMVRDMFGASPQDTTIDFTNMYNLSSSYAPTGVQKVLFEYGFISDIWRLYSGCSRNCFTVRYFAPEEPYKLSQHFILNNDGSIFMSSAECGFAVFSFDAGQGCVNGNGQPIPIHLYRTTDSNVVLRFNNELHRYKQTNSFDNYLCTFHYKEGIHDEERIIVRGYSSVGEAKKQSKCAWRIFDLPQ
jgi:hypothetical protein